MCHFIKIFFTKFTIETLKEQGVLTILEASLKPKHHCHGLMVAMMHNSFMAIAWPTPHLCKLAMFFSHFNAAVPARSRILIRISKKYLINVNFY